jgi:hypothetical protein
MQKFKINSLKNTNLEFFNWYPDHFEIAEHDTVTSLVSSAGIILLTGNIIKTHHIKLNSDNLFVLSMINEGTNTVLDTVNAIGWSNETTLPFIVSSGDLPISVDHINVDIFEYILGRTTPELEKRDSDISENIFLKKNKSFLFNFLNGVNRMHRPLLIEKLNKKGLLKKSLWSALYDNKFLPPAYQHQVNADNVVNGKYKLNDWPDGQIFANIFEDSYFSLVTETNFYLPYSFRTEKIYKPLKIGHPFVVAANYGFYRDLHNKGFKTFGHLIDESFDLIDDNDKRLNRIADTVEFLCNSNLEEFLKAAESICRHNRNMIISTQPPGSDMNLIDNFITKFNNYAKNKQ